VLFGIEKIFPVVETTVCATENIFSEAEKIFVTTDNIFFTTKSIFSVTEKTVREALAVFWPQQRMNSNKQPARRSTKNEGCCPVLRRVGVHDQKSVPKTGHRPQFFTRSPRGMPPSPIELFFEKQAFLL
jgi:hypothetical protein